MQRFSWRGRHVPPEQDTFETSLSDAKYLARAEVLGERPPSARPPAPPRRHHRGLLDDLPLPEGPVRLRRGVVRPALVALARAMGLGERTRGGSPAPGFPAGADESRGASCGANPEPARAPEGIAGRPRLPAAA